MNLDIFKMFSKYKSAGPFLLVCGIMLYTWGEFLFAGNYLPRWQHWLALVLVAGNGVLYFLRYRTAVWVTGIILLLATVNLLSFFIVISAWWITIGGVSTPDIQPWSLLLLVIYGVVNFSTLTNWYLDRKYGPVEKNGES
jgi:hypothetical protein